MRLEASKVRDTIYQLTLRIHDRFPSSGIFDVCGELYSLSKDTEKIVAAIARPLFGVRLVAATLILAFIGAIVFLLLGHPVDEKLSVYSMIGTLESGGNLLILIGLAVIFLWSWERRVRRGRVIKNLNRLREIAHVIDMKQLTKDPDGLAQVSRPTANSPKRRLNAFELGRYLDYCTEMLSLTSKLGYLYVADFHDTDATDAANDLETLCTSLARKIWQKIMILRGVQAEKKEA
ncbi:MAG: hypothetical protein GXX96_17455 [Planctomycetaceae bacterium]|nr:hypothetical protein [Planctomycetaceae bacterium]